jgi:crotonobetainyl-CoA:carnitine CoA-transferase CaiB-like acyl-CoA transferase
MNMNGLLDGITILDLTRVVSGPSCTRSLADLGAEVIKVEPPEGDLWRRGVPKVDDVSVGFAQLNAGKLFMSVDLGTDKGKDLVFKLALQSDVVIENYRPGVAERLGLGYEAIARDKPDIIYCSISGYGQDGPARDRRAYAPIIHAELGLLHQNAREWGTEPMPETASHVDFAVGMQASNGILAALYHRANTGEGVYVDASMAETMLAMNEATSVEINGGLGDQLSPFRPGKAPILQVKNGTYAQLPGNPLTMIFAVARAIGRESELEALGWTSPTSMKMDDAVIKLREWAMEFDDVEALESALDKIRVPVGVVRSLADTVDADWAIARNAFKDVTTGNGAIKVPLSPLRISKHYVGPRTGVSRQGENNRSILAERLGMADDELDQLERENVLITEDRQAKDKSPF